MTPSIRRKLDALAERHEEVAHLLAEPGVSSNPKRFRELSREYSQLEEVVSSLKDFDNAKESLAAAELMRTDPELRDLAEEEIAELTTRLSTLEESLNLLLLPRDPRDDANLFLPVTYFVCMPALPKHSAGKLKS